MASWGFFFFCRRGRGYVIWQQPANWLSGQHSTREQNKNKNVGGWGGLHCYCWYWCISCQFLSFFVFLHTFPPKCGIVVQGFASHESPLRSGPAKRQKPFSSVCTRIKKNSDSLHLQRKLEGHFVPTLKWSLFCKKSEKLSGVEFTKEPCEVLQLEECLNGFPPEDKNPRNRFVSWGRWVNE